MAKDHRDLCRCSSATFSPHLPHESHETSILLFDQMPPFYVLSMPPSDQILLTLVFVATNPVITDACKWLA